MKRYVSLVLAIICIFTLSLVGCGSKTSEAENTPVAETSAAASTPADTAANDAANAESANALNLEPAHLLFVTMGETPKNMDAVNKAASEYLTGLINATLEYRPISWGDYSNKVNLMFASGEKFDLMFTAAWMNESQYAAKGQILAVDDLLAKYAPDYLATVPQDVREAGFINGKAYGLTGYKEWAANKGMIFRKDIADKYGISPDTVKTWADLTPYLEKIKQGEPGMVPIQARSADSPAVGMIDINAFDTLGDGPGVIVRAAGDTKVVNMFEQPAFTEAVKLMRDWFKKGYVNKDAASTTDMTYLAVKAGKAVSYNQSGKPGIASQEARNCGMPVVYIPMDKPYMTTSDAASAILAVPSTSADPARAIMFANLLHKDRYLVNLLNWGVEGQDYVKASDNTIKYPDGMDASNSTYNLNMSWLMGDITLNYLWESDDKDIYEQYKTFNDSADRSAALGFSFDSTPVKNEVAAYNNVRDQYTGALYTGSVDPDTTIPKFIEALKAAGMEKVIAEKQKQLDAFVTAKNK
jgi:putative aldouronate transport system substrate-binding protein